MHDEAIQENKELHQRCVFEVPSVDYAERVDELLFYGVYEIPVPLSIV